MSHFRNPAFHMVGSESMDPTFMVYDHAFQQPFPGPSGPPAHFDGVAFWYRTEPQETMFDQNEIAYNHNVPPGDSSLDPPISIKHRRTRSGCFTCRQRRVKCDENRPICERCKKGNRECHFPQPSSSNRKTDPNDPRTTQSRSSAQENRSEVPHSLRTINDESEDDDQDKFSALEAPKRSAQSIKTARTRREYEAKRRLRQVSDPLDTQDHPSPVSFTTLSPQSRIGTPASPSDASSNSPPSATRSYKWKHLSSEMQEHLCFQQDFMTRYHYFLKLDPLDFLHGKLIDMALSFEPLLYAVVAFAAYHQTLRKPDGRFKDFWKYYCQSIMLLRKWLETHSERNEEVLLTILQLATFEEYLGDWTHLSTHHQAAQSIFSTLYTHDTLMATQTSRCIFDWLARIDVIASLIAGASTTLGRSWFVSALEWHELQVREHEFDVNAAMPYLAAKLRVLGYDMAAVFASAPNNPRATEEIQSISDQMDHLRLEMQALHESNYSVRDTPTRHERFSIPDGSADRHIPLFRDKLWPLNFIWIDWYGTQQMHTHQSALFHQMQQMQTQSTPAAATSQLPDFISLPLELEQLSLVQCQIYEAIEQFPDAPSGAILGCQASLAIASVFLKKEPVYTMWARRKLANFERMGYVWPPSFRQRMAQVWNDDSLLDWWLPNDEGKIHLLNEIRGVVEERNRDIEVRGGDERESLRQMQAILGNLDLTHSGSRIRKDSVWSNVGMEGGKAIATAVTPPSDSGGEDVDQDETNLNVGGSGRSSEPKQKGRQRQHQMHRDGTGIRGTRDSSTRGL